MLSTILNYMLGYIFFIAVFMAVLMFLNINTKKGHIALQSYGIAQIPLLFISSSYSIMFHELGHYLYTRLNPSDYRAVNCSVGLGTGNTFSYSLRRNPHTKQQMALAGYFSEGVVLLLLVISFKTLDSFYTLLLLTLLATVIFITKIFTKSIYFTFVYIFFTSLNITVLIFGNESDYLKLISIYILNFVISLTLEMWVVYKTIKEKMDDINYEFTTDFTDYQNASYSKLKSTDVFKVFFRMTLMFLIPSVLILIIM